MSPPDAASAHVFPEPVVCPITGLLTSFCALDPFDREYIRDNYTRLDCREILKEVLGIVCTAAPQKLALLCDAFQNGDQEMLTGYAHGLKGEAGSAGAAVVRQLAARIESAARAGDLAAVNSELPHLKREIDFFVAAAHREFDLLPPCQHCTSVLSTETLASAPA